MLVIALLCLAEILNGFVLAEKVDWKYYVEPVTATVGECVTFEAKRNFPGYNATSTTITWTKDSRPVVTGSDMQVNGRTLHVSYVHQNDAAYYQAIIEDKTNNLRETTGFWLNVRDCKPNEVERAGKTAKCKSSCVEMCPSGWHYVKGVRDKCFQYFNTKRTWDDAQDQCQNLGGQLASVENNAENEFVGNLLQTGDGAWIGVNDRDTEAQFVWNYNRYSIASYSSWASGEPNNDNSKCNFENCVEITKDGYWSDLNCLMYLPYVCQKSSTSKDTNGWKCRGDTCYKYFRFPQLWEDSWKICRKEGGKLVEIESDAVNELVRGLLEQNAWIGLNDYHEAGLYIWNDKSALGRKAAYFNWASGQPSDLMYMPNHDEKCKGQDCVRILIERNNSVNWHDIECDQKIPYICERLRDSHLTKGAIIGITIGSLIGVSVVAGLVHEVVRRRNKSAVQSMIQSAYLQDYNEMREKEFKPRRKSLWKVALRWKRPSRVGPMPMAT